MIRVGILGCASIARRSLAPAFADHAAFDLVGVASRTVERAQEFIGGLRAAVTPAVYTYDALVDSPDVDLVYCPLPTGLHYEWVKRALLAGKHVLCEKSLACSLGEVEDLVKTARDHGRFLMESFQFRFHPQNLFVRKLLSERAIGELRNIVIRFGIPPFPEGVENIRYSRNLGGGALLDNGAYTIKAATYLLGHDIRVLSAMRGCGKIVGVDSYRNLDVDVVGSIMMSTGEVSIQTSYGFDHFYQNGYEIWGSEGKISTLRAFTARADYAAPVIVETKAGRDVQTFRADHFAALLDYVSSCVAENDFTGEYEESLVQARLLSRVFEIGSVS